MKATLELQLITVVYSAYFEMNVFYPKLMRKQQKKIRVDIFNILLSRCCCCCWVNCGDDDSFFLFNTIHVLNYFLRSYVVMSHIITAISLLNRCRQDMNIYLKKTNIFNEEICNYKCE